MSAHSSWRIDSRRGALARAVPHARARSSAGRALQSALRYVRIRSRTVSEYSRPSGAPSAPHAQSRPGLRGSTTWRIPKSSASSHACIGPAPPNASSAKSRGSKPRSTVITRIARSMLALTTRITPRAAVASRSSSRSRACGSRAPLAPGRASSARPGNSPRPAGPRPDRRRSPSAYRRVRSRPDPVRARAFRPDLKRAARIDRARSTRRPRPPYGYRSPACAPRSRRIAQRADARAAVEQRHVGRGPAHVEGDEAIDAHRAHQFGRRRPRPPPAPTESCGPARRARARYRSRRRWIASRGAPSFSSWRFEIAQMRNHAGRDVGIHHGRRQPLVLAIFGAVSDGTRRAADRAARARRRSPLRSPDSHTNGASRRRRLRRHCAAIVARMPRQFVGCERRLRSLPSKQVRPPTPKRNSRATSGSGRLGRQRVKLGAILAADFNQVLEAGDR